MFGEAGTAPLEAHRAAERAESERLYGALSLCKNEQENNFALRVGGLRSRPMIIFFRSTRWAANTECGTCGFPCTASSGFCSGILLMPPRAVLFRDDLR